MDTGRAVLLKAAPYRGRMNTSAHAVAAEPLAVKRVAKGVWILRLLESLEGGAVSSLRQACGDAIERDATDLVVDLGSVAAVSVEGAAALAAMVDLMHSRGGALWIAGAWPHEDGYTLRPVHQPSPAGLLGVSPALDRALEALDGDGEENLLDLRDAPATA